MILSDKHCRSAVCLFACDNFFISFIKYKQKVMDNKMLRSIMVLGASAALAMTVSAQNVAREYDLDEVEVLGTRPGELTPLTKLNLDVNQLSKGTTAWDVPMMLRGTPSLITTTDSGLFGGYTGFSIRGIDPSRVNITVNGIPVNDSESQAVFWANMPDFGSRLSDIVIVRGAGASTFGAGAFGATMDMRTALPSAVSGGAVSTYWGMYGLNRNTLTLHTGNISGTGLRLSAALSGIHSDGYVDRSNSRGRSYLIQAYYGGENYSLRLIHHLGDQKTGISWNGISPEDIEKYGRTHNSAGLMNPGADPKDFRYYDDQTDNYRQGHTYAIFRHAPTTDLSYEVTLHHTGGKGFTREYRTGRKMGEYRLAPATDKTKIALIREKYLENDFYGGVGNLMWRQQWGHLNAGVAVNHYTGDHFGKLPWAEVQPNGFTPNQEYYRNHSTKTDASGYIKAEVKPTDNLLLYADLMYRHVRATMDGPTDRMNGKTKELDVLDYVGDKALSYNFVLPKVGLTYLFSRNASAYLSYAMAGKEPNRKMYTESKMYGKSDELIMPSPEYMGDLELGGNYTARTLSLFANLYFMHYKDQIVPNGQKSDVGEDLMINVPRSYRLGLEAGFSWKALPSLTLDFNGTISKNNIIDYTFYEDDQDTWEKVGYTQKETPIANSPALILNHAITWNPWSTLSFRLGGQYLSKRHLDNSGLSERTLPAHYVGDLVVSYDYELPKQQALAFQLQVINLYNTDYASYGGVYGYTKGGKRGHDIWLYPAAPTHFVAGVTYRF